MSDLGIIGIIILVMVVLAVAAGWRAGQHLAAPPRKRSDDD